VTRSFFNWLDHRTGYRNLISAMLLEDIPGGARWRYVWGSTLVFVFSLQLITGILLMTAYSPGDTTAWASVHFIQYQMDFGWLIRGLHHFGSQTMMVLIALHMLQVVIAGAHLPPREVNWWLGLGLLSVTFGLSLTGYLLPWDQKGYWATRVATNIASNTPFIGDFLKRLLVGGDDYGNHTLTRFYALHVCVLPLALIALTTAHLYVFRRHGITAPPRAEGEEYFWPGQAFRDLIACLLVFGVMISLVVFGGHGNPVDVPSDRQPANLYQDWAHAGQKGLGANLDAPADRDTPNYPARPEWYFLFLFQLLKYFEGPQVLIGTFVIPNAAMVLLFLLPLLGYGPMRKFGHFFGVLVMMSLLGGVVLLTAMALIDDSPYLLEKVGDKDAKKLEKAQQFQNSVEHAEKNARRAANLAMAGVPQDGARVLLRTDPLTHGQRVFKANCASCHAFTPRAGEGELIEVLPRTKDRKASDLGDFASAKWIRGLLENPGDEKYFGGIEQLDGMKEWKDSIKEVRATMAPADIEKQEKEFDDIANWLARQALPRADRPKEGDAEGRQLFKQHCARCHRVEDIGPKQTAKGDRGPELTGYGSADWIRGMILAPAAKTRYGQYYKDAREDPKTALGLMPPFYNPESPGARDAMHERNPTLPDSMTIQLSDIDRESVIRFMLRDFRAVFGGKEIAAAPK
jgi:ubiquinol-cytochrome c reductase cytochrome b subunit